jgi:hypothetical protein
MLKAGMRASRRIVARATALQWGGTLREIIAVRGGVIKVVTREWRRCICWKRLHCRHCCCCRPTRAGVVAAARWPGVGREALERTHGVTSVGRGRGSRRASHTRTRREEPTPTLLYYALAEQRRR